MIFLAGGGNAEQSKPIDAAWINSLEEAAADTVVYIPFAQKEEKLADSKEWFLYTYEKRLGRFIIKVIEGNISEVDMDRVASIYIGGGNTERLMRKLMSDDTQLETLRSFIDSGGNIYGGSAGAIILGKKIYTAPEVNDEYSNTPGLDLLDGKSVACHYGTERGLSMDKLSNLSKSGRIIAITENGGVILDGNKLHAIGADAYIWHDGGHTETIVSTQ